jgi:hypothetical protein
MWVFQRDQLFNLRHAVDVWLDGNLIRIGFVDGSRTALHFENDAEAKRFFQVLVLRLGRLDGVLIAEGVEHAGQG